MNNLATIPYNKMNYLLFNCKRKVWDVDLNYVLSFREYVKSQIQFPLTPRIYNRNLVVYKEVYNFLEKGIYVNEDRIAEVLYYYYEDLYDSISRVVKKDSVTNEEFYLDYDGILDLFPVKVINVKTIDERLNELNKARLSSQVYLVIFGGE